MRIMGAAKAKTHLLTLLDEVQTRREPILVTKNGRPVAQLVPLAADAEQDPLAIYKFGGGAIIGDILAPADDPDDWEYD